MDNIKKSLLRLFEMCMHPMVIIAICTALETAGPELLAATDMVPAEYRATVMHVLTALVAVTKAIHFLAALLKKQEDQDAILKAQASGTPIVDVQPRNGSIFLDQSQAASTKNVTAEPIAVKIPEKP